MSEFNNFNDEPPLPERRQEERRRTGKHYVTYAQLTSAERLRRWIDKGNLLPDPLDILQEEVTPDLVRLYKAARTHTDNLMAALADVVFSGDFKKNGRGKVPGEAA